MLSTAFGSTSLVPEALRLLHGHGVAFGAETTIRRDLAASFDDVARLVKDLVKDTVGSLVIDGATFKHMHSLGVMYKSAWLDEPVLLGLIFAEPNDDELDGCTYDNVRCALAASRAWIWARKPPFLFVLSRVIARCRLLSRSF